MEKKKGFWASLFMPKQDCCCGIVIEKVPQKPIKEELNTEDGNNPEDNNVPKCSCGANC